MSETDREKKKMEDWVIIMSYVWSGLFLVSGTVSTLVGFFSRNPHRKDAAFVGGVALLSTCVGYLLQAAIPDRPDIRWIFYTVACPFLIQGVGETLGNDKLDSIVSGIFMALTLAPGFLIYYIGAIGNRWALFGVGVVPYIISLTILYYEKPTERLLCGSWVKTTFFWFVVLSWSCYPIAYILGPALTGAISFEAEFVIYFILEIPAKLVVDIVNIVIVEDSDEKIKNKNKTP